MKHFPVSQALVVLGLLLGVATASDIANASGGSGQCYGCARYDEGPPATPLMHEC